MAQPLTDKFPIVDPQGKPTPYFIRLLQERGFTVDDKITAEQALELINDVLSDHSVNAGAGLSGGGPLISDPTLTLNASLGQLNDVDLSTPPTDGQVIAYDAGAGLWLPANQSGGGGGGGGGLAAWVQFVPGSPPTIQGSEGITSVTRTNTGRYRITFSSAFADNNYIIAASARFGDSTTTDTTPIIGVDRRTGFGKTTGYVDITITTDTAAVSDNLTFVNVGFMPAKVSSGGGGSAWWFDPPAASSFSKLSPAGTLTLADDPDVGMTATLSNTGTNHFAYRTLTNPAADWDLIYKIDAISTTQNYSSWALAIRDSVGGRMHQWGLTSNQGLTRQNMTSNTSWSSSPYNQLVMPGTLYSWFRIQSSGSNLNFYVSGDGKQWALVGTVGATSWLANRANQVGFMLLQNSSLSTFAIPYFSLTGPAV